MADIALDPDLDDSDSPPVEKKQKVFETCGLETRHEEKVELGKPDVRKGCFGCVYVGERDPTAIQYENIAALVDMITKTIARTDPINLSIHVAKRYKKMQTDINNNLLPGEEPLPEWSAASVLDHIRNHNTDPQIQTWLRMCEIQELMQVALEASVEIDKETGDKRVVSSQVKIYLDLLKVYESLSKSDPSKKLFYKPNAHIDMNANSQGLLAVSGKNIFKYNK